MKRPWDKGEMIKLRTFREFLVYSIEEFEEASETSTDDLERKIHAHIRDMFQDTLDRYDIFKKHGQLG